MALTLSELARFARVYSDTIDTFDSFTEQPKHLLKPHTFLLSLLHYRDILLKTF